jgi:hypothetical protein
MNDKHFVALVSLLVLLTGWLAFMLQEHKNCYEVQYQQQGISKTSTVCERTNK